MHRRPALGRAPGTKVTFAVDGTTLVNGKRFFPVGIWLYELNETVLADIHEQQFNTVLWNSPVIHPEHLKTVHEHGLMAICHVNDEWFPAAKDSPALLTWILQDEPESQGKSPAEMLALYRKVKPLDPDHPFGMDHSSLDAFARFKDACDLTMSDIYPITRDRTLPITHVGLYVDEAHRVHKTPNWPHWAFIQVFGGSDTDGGVWAQPFPHEVRCMTYMALAHGANGILYFSYWPRAERTWSSLGALNRELYRLIPWLVAPGREREAKSSTPSIHVRARQVGNGGIVIAVNTTPRFTEMRVTVPGLKEKRLRRFFQPGEIACTNGELRDGLGPFEERVYAWGPEPRMELAGRK